jgi:hypothetical protein
MIILKKLYVTFQSRNQTNTYHQRLNLKNYLVTSKALEVLYFVGFVFLLLYALFFLFISFRTLFVTHGSLCLYDIILCDMFVCYHLVWYVCMLSCCVVCLYVYKHTTQDDNIQTYHTR